MEFTYRGLTAEFNRHIVTDSEVDQHLHRMQQQTPRITEVTDRPTENGDEVVLDYAGFCDGVQFPGGTAEMQTLVLGSGRFIPGFEEQLLDKVPGEEVVVKVTFPEQYHAEELAGKAAEFRCKIHSIRIKSSYELNDEFAKEVGGCDTLEELKADIRAKALESAEKQAASAFEQACVEKAAENTTVDMPAALIETELDNQMDRFGYQLQMSGYSMEQYAKMMGGDVTTMRNAFRPAAEKQAKINVTLEKIAEVEGIEVTEEDLNAEFEVMAKQYELEIEKIKEMVPAEEIKQSLKTRKAVKVITDSAVAVAPKAE